MRHLTSIFLGFLLLLSGVLPGMAEGQITRISPPDTTSGTWFGTSVAIDGEWAVIGATGDDGCGENAGAAWVYRAVNSDQWVLDARLTSSDCGAEHFFGNEVKVDGGRIVVSSFRTFVNREISNAVHVFERQDTVWVQTARIVSPDDSESGPFAASLDLDGDTILITSSGDTSRGSINGKGFIFEPNTRGTWVNTAVLESPLPPSAGVLGISSALDGDRAVLGGSTYSRGRPGMVVAYQRNAKTGAWDVIETLRGIRDFFISLDIRGDRLVIGESQGGSQQSGEVRVYRSVDDGWTLEASLEPTTPYAYGAFGSEVALGDDFVLVSGFDEQLDLDINVDQVVYVFVLKDGSWRQRRILDVGESAFGASLDLDQGRAIIGQAAEDLSGHAFVAQINRP